VTKVQKVLRFLKFQIKALSHEFVHGKVLDWLNGAFILSTGPSHWADTKIVKHARDTRNHCPTLWASPTDIKTRSVLSADVNFRL